MNVKSENHLVIHGFMRTELGLSGNDLLVYAIIYGFSQDGNSRFIGSLQYLADWCGCSKQGIQKNIKNLLGRNLINKEELTVNGIRYVKYYTTELHTIQLSCTNNISNNNINNNINNTNIQQELFTDNNTSNKEVINKEDTYKIKGQKFVDDFNSICKSLPKCQRLTPKRTKGITNLLKKFDYSDILEVFNKLEESDFCTGRSGKWRADIDFILREDKFISVLEGKYDNRGRGCNVETISRGTKQHITEDEKEEIRKAVERGELKEY